MAPHRRVQGSDPGAETGLVRHGSRTRSCGAVGCALRHRPAAAFFAATSRPDCWSGLSTTFCAGGRRDPTSHPGPPDAAWTHPRRRRTRGDAVVAAFVHGPVDSADYFGEVALRSTAGGRTCDRHRVHGSLRWARRWRDRELEASRNRLRELASRTGVPRGVLSWATSDRARGRLGIGEATISRRSRRRDGPHSGSRRSCPATDPWSAERAPSPPGGRDRTCWEGVVTSGFSGRRRQSRRPDADAVIDPSAARLAVA